MILVAAVSCTSSRKMAGIPAADRALADSVLAFGLDHEAVYSLLDTLKPISSLKLLWYPIAKDSTMAEGDVQVVKDLAVLDKIDQYQRLCRSLSRGDWQFVLIPFNMTSKQQRSMEIYVVRKARFAAVLREHAAFFGQWGFTAASDPAVVLTAIEFERQPDRYRAYGYLFGYPPYAVDFFVESTLKTEADPAKKLVPRDFFQVPVFAGKSGYFTYAMPKGHQPGAQDSTLYNKAVQTLERYKNMRPQYISKGGFRATALWMDWNGSKPRK